MSLITNACSLIVSQLLYFVGTLIAQFAADAKFFEGSNRTFKSMKITGLQRRGNECRLAEVEREIHKFGFVIFVEF